MAKKTKKGKKKKITEEEIQKREEEFQEEKRHLEATVAELQAEYEEICIQLRSKQDDLENLRNQHRNQSERLKASAQYLRRHLLSMSDDFDKAQIELVQCTELDNESRIKYEEKKLDTERRISLDRKHFQQKMSEREDQLFQLEGKRVLMVNQQVRRGRLQEALSGPREKETDRGKIVAQVSSLLRRRDDFARAVKELAAEHEMVFENKLPVYAQELLEENKNLQKEAAAEKLIKVQSEACRLRDKQRNLELEVEMEDAIEVRIREERKKLEEELKRKSDFYGNSSVSFAEPEKDGKSSQMSLSTELYTEDTESSRNLKRYMIEKDNCLLKAHVQPIPCNQHINVSKPLITEKSDNKITFSKSDSELHVIQKTKNETKKEFKARSSEHDIRMINYDPEFEEEIIQNRIYRLEDKTREMFDISDDQEQYQKFLDEEYQRIVEKNGKLCSIVIKAGEVFRSRKRQKAGRDSSNMDYEVLNQLRILLSEDSLSL